MNKKMLIIAVAGIALLTGASAAAEHREAVSAAKNGIEREAVGGAEQSKTLRYRIDDGEAKEISLEISPRILPEEEANALLETAREEWEGLYLGENRSAEHVDHNLNLPQELAEGLVQVRSTPDQPTVMEEDGALLAENIPADGTLISLETVFTYETYELTDVRSLHVYPPQKDSEEALEEMVYEAASGREQNSREEKNLTLPTEVNGHRISWETEETMRWVVVLLLGAAAVAAMYFREEEEKKKKQKEREARLLYEYPQMIEQICLLLGSGMTIRRAWERMVRTYQRQRELYRIPEKLYANEMQITEFEMKKGRGERECYERFAGRIGLEPYRRFAAILTRNLSKGNDDIRHLLEEEADQAMLMRKNTAVRLGEEASTKLLGPMLLMFLVILAAVIFPALENF